MLRQARDLRVPRSVLAAAPGFARLSPEEGALDEDEAGAMAGEDAAAALALLARMAMAQDRTLAAKALRLATEIVIELSTGERGDGRGIGRLRRAAADTGGDLDLEVSLPAIAHRRALGELPSGDDLVARRWARRPRSACVVVDRSGSMDGDRLVAAALAAAVVAFHARGDYSVVAFAGDALVVKAHDEPRRLDDVLQDLFALKAYGTTNVALGLRAALGQLERARGSREVVLLSDCDANAGGDPRPYARRLDALHVLTPWHGAEVGRILAAAGGGRWAALERPTDVPAALAHIYAR